MISAENKCRTYKNDDLERSPTVKIWLKRRWFLGRVQRFKARKAVRIINCYKNLKQACARHGIKAPNFITPDELNMEVKTCRQKLKELEQSAPRLRVEHLLNRRQDALK